MIISYDMYDIYMIYQPFEQLVTYFGHMVTISDLGAGPQSRPLPLVVMYNQNQTIGIV